MIPFISQKKGHRNKTGHTSIFVRYDGRWSGALLELGHTRGGGFT